MPSLRVGLLGCGRIARNVHLATLRHLPQVRLAALAESDPARRSDAGRRAPEASLFPDYRDVLERDEIEAVIICLPPALHAEATRAAFDAGKHVYLEKPLAVSCTEAAPVLKAWRAAERVGMIGFNYRFDPRYEQARAILRAGGLGEPVAVRSVFSSAVRTLPAWKRVRNQGGGALLDLASHHIDLLPYLLGTTVEAVSARVSSRHSDDDTAALRLHLSNGIIVQSMFAFGTVDEDVIEVYGSRGKLRVDRYRTAAPVVTAPAFAYGRMAELRRAVALWRQSLQRLAHPPGEPSFQAALTAFVDTVHGRAEPLPTLDDGYRSLAVVEAAEASARSGGRCGVDVTPVAALSTSANADS